MTKRPERPMKSKKRGDIKRPASKRARFRAAGRAGVFSLSRSITHLS